MGKYLIKIFKEDLLNFFEIKDAGITLEKMLATTMGMTVIKSTTGGQDTMIMAIVWLAIFLSVILHKISLQSLLKLPKAGRISCNQGLCLTLSFFF